MSEVPEHLLSCLGPSSSCQREEASAPSVQLEEANLWFQKFAPYFAHNERALHGQSLVVQRQLLNTCIEASLASVLQTEDKIMAETPIIGAENICLSHLIEIFLEQNPLLLRHYHFRE